MVRVESSSFGAAMNEWDDLTSQQKYNSHVSKGPLVLKAAFYKSFSRRISYYLSLSQNKPRNTHKIFPWETLNDDRVGSRSAHPPTIEESSCLPTLY